MAAYGAHYEAGPSQLEPSGLTGYPEWPYYVVADGIQHEVIQTDLGRFLSNDAVVRRHVYQGVDVYIYKAYRQLTNAMISSLKEDSRKWNMEKNVYPERAFHDSRTFYDRMQKPHPDLSQPTPRGPPPPAPFAEPAVPAAGGYPDNGRPPRTSRGHHNREPGERQARDPAYEPHRGGYGYADNRVAEPRRDSSRYGYGPEPGNPEPVRDVARYPVNAEQPRDTSRYAYDSQGNAYYDLQTRQYLPSAGGAEVPRGFVQDAAPPTGPPAHGVSGTRRERHQYPTAPPGDARYPHGRPYEPTSDEE